MKVSLLAKIVLMSFIRIIIKRVAQFRLGHMSIKYNEFSFESDSDKI